MHAAAPEDSGKLFPIAGEVLLQDRQGRKSHQENVIVGMDRSNEMLNRRRGSTDLRFHAGTGVENDTDAYR